METQLVFIDWKTMRTTELSKVIYRFNVILIKIPIVFFLFFRNEETHPPIHMELKGAPNSQHNFEKEQRW